MIVGSVCTGIASDAVAWAPLGWRHAFFAEWAPPEWADVKHKKHGDWLVSQFNQHLLTARHPSVPNLGDFTTIRSAPDGTRIDLLVGGTPCQSFSAAGLRGGLDDSRGQLALEFLRLADRLSPRWVVWENVPGVLSADEGRAFGSLLGGLAELGYGFAWRVLDAQFFGLAQRRKRVFVVGRAGARSGCAAAVLLERSGMRWDPAPRRAQGSTVAGCLEARSRSGGYDPGAGGAGGQLVVADVAGTLKATKRGAGFEDAAAGHLVATGPVYAIRSDATTRSGEARTPSVDAAGRLRLRDPSLGISEDIAPTLDGRGAHSVCIPFDTAQITHRENRSRPEAGDPSPTLSKTGHPPAVAFNIYPVTGQGADLEAQQTDVAAALSRVSLASKTKRGTRIVTGSRIRRFTPRECERLMGHADGYTAIMIDGKPAADRPRYAALGNGIAVPVLAWIGRRIEAVDALAAVDTP